MLTQQSVTSVGNARTIIAHQCGEMLSSRPAANRTLTLTHIDITS